jgi:hypothetical protein
LFYLLMIRLETPYYNYIERCFRFHMIYSSAVES